MPPPGGPGTAGSRLDFHAPRAPARRFPGLPGRRGGPVSGAAHLRAPHSRPSKPDSCPFLTGIQSHTRSLLRVNYSEGGRDGRCMRARPRAQRGAHSAGHPRAPRAPGGEMSPDISRTQGAGNLNGRTTKIPPGFRSRLRPELVPKFLVIRRARPGTGAARGGSDETKAEYCRGRTGRKIGENLILLGRNRIGANKWQYAAYMWNT